MSGIQMGQTQSSTGKVRTTELTLQILPTEDEMDITA